MKEEAEASDNTRPNIILIVTDDLDYASAQRMDGLGSLLREEGVSFGNAFVSYPLCCPSRATVLTGLYAHNHEVWGNLPPNGGFEKFREEGSEESTIAVRLQEGGYRTALFGKYLNHYPGGDLTYVPPGWDEWHASVSPSTSYYDYELNENGTVVSYGQERGDYLTDVLSGKAADFVRQAASDAGGRPFFAYLAPPAPHLPATPARRHRGTFAEEMAPRPPSFDEEDISDKPPWMRKLSRISDKTIAGIEDRHRKRMNSMLAVEEMVASLVGELEAAGILDETYIFFTSDNGWQGGEHRIPLEKSWPYEESAHVPLFVRGPGVSPGAEVEQLVSNTDFAPTFAELADVEFAGDGRSLAPLLRGEDPAWRSAVLLEASGEAGPPGFEAVRTRRHKYVEYVTGDRELYDLEADPYEMESLHDSADPALAESLKASLEALASCSGQSCREAEDAP
ncbi:MAG: sulfatase [Rubrobacter sp.]|nr:sulfatase [Rubrobacter sp.]